MDPDDLPGLQKILTPVQENQITAEKDELSSKGKFEDMKSRLAISRLKWMAEKQVYDESIKLLDVVAPADGWFVASVGQGGFVLSGDPIGVVHFGVSKAQKQTLILAAPDDVTIASLPNLNGDVKSRQPIATLSASRIDRFQTQLQAANEDLNVRKRFFANGRNSKWEAILNQEVASASLALEAAKRTDRTTALRWELGLINRPVRLQALIDRALGEAPLATAKLDQQQFPNKVKDLQDRIDNTEKRLRKEAALLQELVDQLPIVAPTIPEGSKAQFVASVGQGGFVQSGDPIGVIHL
jgi:hypothetical protein